MNKLVSIIVLIVLYVMMLNGCGKKEGDEPTKYMSQDGLEQLTHQAQQSAVTSVSASSNPKFASAKNISPKAATAKDIDGIIRPVLRKLFNDAKLISAVGPETPQKDGEVIEDRLNYAVKVIFKESDGDKLHSALCSAGFSTSPRLGSKPTHSRGNVYMSLMESTSMRGYSFVIIVHTDTQKIEVESYKLGSKYDRLM